jgi:hypothetical protein
MFLVPADLLRHSVEMALRKFFRMVRSVKGSSLPDPLSLKTPVLCTDYLKTLFARIALSLSHFPTMQQHDSYFRFHRDRRKEIKALPKPVERAAKAVTSTVKFEVAEKESIPSSGTINTSCGRNAGILHVARVCYAMPYVCSQCDYSSSLASVTVEMTGASRATLPVLILGCWCRQRVRQGRLAAVRVEGTLGMVVSMSAIGMWVAACFPGGGVADEARIHALVIEAADAARSDYGVEAA